MNAVPPSISDMETQPFTERSQLASNSQQPVEHATSTASEELPQLTTAGAPSAAIQLLTAAVGKMNAGDIYCEIGCGQGDTLIAVLQNHPDVMAYAVTAFEPTPASDTETLITNLGQAGLDERVLVCDQTSDAFFAELRAADLSDRIGVCFYNGSPDYRSLMLSLMLATHFLADQALIVVAHANSAMVRQTVWDFLTSYPQAALAFDPATDGTTPDTANLFGLSWNVANTAMATVDWQQQRDSAVIAAIYDLSAAQPTINVAADVTALRQEAVQLHIEGRLTEAEPLYKAILQLDPQNAEIWLNLGMLYSLAENDTAAIETLQQAVALNPAPALAHHMVGFTWERLGHAAEARAAYEQAIAIDPNYADALNRLGNLLVKANALSEAEALFQRAIALQPDRFTGYLNLGNVLVLQQRFQAAIDAYRQALIRKKRDPDILHKLGDAYQAVSDRVNAHSYTAYGFYREGNHAQAIAEFEQLQAIDVPLSVDDYLVLHDCYHHCGQLQNAILSLQQAAQLRPDDAFLAITPQLVLPALYQTVDELLEYRQRVIQGFASLKDAVQTAHAQNQSIDISGIQYFTNFYLSYQGYNDRDVQAIYGQLLHEWMAGHYPEWIEPRVMPPLSQSSKIRIGYLADSIGDSSATRWALGWLKHHDRSRFEIYCYNVGAVSDRKTEQFKTLSDAYHHIPDNTAAVCQQILADDLHVLVFLAIGTWAPIAQLASLRLAPVQCSTWGHPVTSGLPTVDYFLSGDLMEPENAQEHYTEQLVRLPNIGICYPKPLMPEPTKTRADFGLPETAVVYLSCQLIFKYLPQHDYLYVEIARRVPDAKLVFVMRSTTTNRSNPTLEAQFQQRLHRAFAAVGLNRDDHCIFLPSQNWDGYISLLSIADVFLDTPSFSGGHTTFDAIACNLPIVTIPGELMRGRQSDGALKLLGVTDTIAPTAAAYVDTAVKLGLEPEWRRTIAQRMQAGQSQLFGDTTCVAGLEQFYQQVVTERLAQQAKSSTNSAEAMPAIAKKLILHVGCGPYNPNALPDLLSTPDWQEVRLDINPDVQPDIIGSITDMHAVADASVDAVFSSHNLEHLYAHEVPQALAEFYRVLKPGGFVLITLPDIQKVAEYVAQGKLEEPLYVSSVGPITALDILYGLGSAIADGNHFMAHRTAFTEETLRQKLEQAGFQGIEVHRDGLNLWERGYK